MRLGLAKLSFERYQRGSKWPASPGGVQGSWLERVFGFLMEADGRLSRQSAKRALVVMVTEEVDRDRRLSKFGDDRRHSWRSGRPLDHVQGSGGTDLKGPPEAFPSGITHLIFSFRHSCPSSSDHRVPSEPAGLLVVRLMSKG